MKAEDFSFGKDHRVLKLRDFARIKSKGRKRGARRLLLIQLANQLGTKRLGIIVTRKVGKANIRNRWKRYIREFFRLNKRIFPPATDSLFIVKKGFVAPQNYFDIEKELRALVCRPCGKT